MRARYWVSALFYAWVALASQTYGSGVLLVRPNSARFREAVNEFRRAYPGCIEADPREQQALARRLQSDRPEVIVAVGSEAARMANPGRGGIPLVLLMVHDADRLELTGTNIGGVSMDIPGGVQLSHFKELLSGRKTVAILHQSRPVPAVVAQAEAAADQLGIRIRTVPVASSAEVRGRFNFIKELVQAVWLIPENLSAGTMDWEFLWKETAKEKFPLFITDGEMAVAGGALASLVTDLADMGRQCGDLVRQLTTGKANVAELRMQPPRMVRWVVNTKTAARIDLKIPADILKAPTTRKYP